MPRHAGSRERRERLAHGGLLAALALVGCADAPEPPRQPDVVLLVIDTLRADRIEPYGALAGISPALAALAARGAVLEDMQATAPWTLPSTASLLTGLHPYRHGADLDGEMRDLHEDLPAALAESARTLAEVLREHGYTTKGYAANPFVSFGLERGFDELTVRNTEAAEIAAWLVDELAADADAPRFLYGHFMDVHTPYLMPVADVEHVADLRGLDEIPPVEFRATAPPVPSAEVRDAALATYDAAVHYVDRCIGRVVAALEARGALESTIVCVVSDHGEELFEHHALQVTSGSSDPRGTPGLGHGHTLFAELTRVPCVLVGPGVPAARIAGTASLQDVAPTLLELAGLDPATLPGDGASLVPRLRGAAPAERALLLGSIAYGRDREALVTDAWKLIVDPQTAAPLHLFDRRADPHEQDDVLAAHPDVAERLLLELAKRRATLRRAAPAKAPGPSDAVRRGLRAIGY